ncbi:MAG TPA: deoxyribose-phosphate aldolase [Candidatus Eisenbacteria bacterium]|nr:deoxyribose-phosphate aldolase [Candidatus Eisenbacteria bacterium]
MTAAYSYSDIAKMIDHSLLNPALTVAELEAGCQLALRYDVASVCILPYYVDRCAQLLSASTVQPSTTIGFPHGGHTTAVKLAEVAQALKDGATELDMVINISQARSGNWDYVEREVRLLTVSTHAASAKIKVIFENAYFDDAAKIRLCQICGNIGADWAKTSTGYASSGATLADLALMRRHSPPMVQVKAAGGIRTLDALLAVRALGVTRVGATRTADMLDDCRQRLGLPAIEPAPTAPGDY